VLGVSSIADERLIQAGAVVAVGTDVDDLVGARVGDEAGAALQLTVDPDVPEVEDEVLVDLLQGVLQLRHGQGALDGGQAPFVHQDSSICLNSVFPLLIWASRSAARKDSSAASSSSSWFSRESAATSTRPWVGASRRRTVPSMREFSLVGSELLIDVTAPTTRALASEVRSREATSLRWSRSSPSRSFITDMASLSCSTEAVCSWMLGARSLTRFSARIWVRRARCASVSSLSAALVCPFARASSARPEATTAVVPWGPAVFAAVD